MMNVQVYPETIAIAGTSTNTICVGNSERIMLQVPAVAARFASGVVRALLQGAYASAVSAQTTYFYDYVTKAPTDTVITMSTGGIYEIPNVGGVPYVKISFDVAATVAVGINVIVPKIGN